MTRVQEQIVHNVFDFVVVEVKFSEPLELSDEVELELVELVVVEIESGYLGREAVVLKSRAERALINSHNT